MKRTKLFPEGTQFETSSSASEARFELPEDFPYFEGHFPERPIVPGVTQLGWAMELCARLKGSRPTGVTRLRFTKPVEPNQSIRVRVEPSPKGIACQVFADDSLAAKGTLTYA